MNLDVVADEAQFTKIVHKKGDAGARFPDHLCQRFLTDLNIDWLRNAFFAESGENQQKARKASLAGIEQLVDQVFQTTSTGYEIGDEKLREARLVLERAWSSRPRDCRDRRGRHRYLSA